MKKSTIYFLLSIVFIYAANAQTARPIMADLHCHSILKPFYSQMDDPWTFWEHNCAEDTYKAVLEKSEDIPKFTQGNFESMLLGNVRVVYVSLTPLEYEMRHPKIYHDLGKLRNTFACMAGASPAWGFFMDEKVDYFKDLLGQFELLQKAENRPFFNGEDSLHFEIVTSAKQYREILNDPLRLGVVVSIEGAHALGEGPLSPELLASPYYHEQVLEHLDVLKGIVPMDREGNYLPFPVCVMTLNHFMWNGLGGHAKTFGTVQGLLFNQSEGLNTGITPLGEQVVEKMLDKSNGRRIIPDVKHMSIPSRQWYYDLMAKMRLEGDTVPIVATHVGVGGESWDVVSNSKLKKMHKTCDWLYQEPISIFDEDVREIAMSKGILGIMLDKYRLGGSKAHEMVDESRAGSQNRRKVYIKLLVLNMLEVVDALQSKEAWDIISIGSDFDGMISAMETYDQGFKFGSLYEDLLAFFDSPEDIWDLYPRRKIQRYMYGLSASEITEKVMGGNLISFTERMLENDLGLPAEGIQAESAD